MNDELDTPEAVVVPRARLPANLIWAIPLLAALIAAWLALDAIRTRGPTVTISFRDARGLVAGTTKIKYRDVEVGEVRAIGFSRDRSQVLVTAELTRSAEAWMVEDTRFWIVEPHITIGEVSGLDTLVSGAFIALDVGTSPRSRRVFEGLASPPIVTPGTPGRAFVARTDRALRVGTPIYFRHLDVGQVTASELDADGGNASIGMFVRAPYDRYVTTATRFWDVSGIRGSVDANGARIETESVTTILLGGISFEPSGERLGAPPAPPNHVFVLFRSREEAMKQPEGDGEDARLVFHQSIRGLSVGAPVDFRGIPFGEVTHIGVEYNPTRVEFSMVVDVRIYPERVQTRMRGNTFDDSPEAVDNRVKLFVEHGLRGQLRTANLLTGQLYVALDFFPHAPRVAYDLNRQPREIPTIPSEIEDLRESVATIVRKIDHLPVDDLARLVGDARQMLASADTALGDADGVVKLFKPTAARGVELDDALRQVSRAARSVRGLADSLDRHPESLVRGRK
jgi:paraquat-inducible protein B